MDEFEKWISKKLSGERKPKKGTYRERVLSGSQSAWNQKKRKPMRSRSKKRQKEELKYSKASKKYLEENPCCEVCGKETNLSIHHKKGRIGSLLCDERYFMTACLIGNFLDDKYPDSNHSGDGCHGWIHANPRKAKELGYVL